MVLRKKDETMKKSQKSKCVFPKLKEIIFSQKIKLKNRRVGLFVYKDRRNETTFRILVNSLIKRWDGVKGIDVHSLILSEEATLALMELLKEATEEIDERAKGN